MLSMNLGGVNVNYDLGPNMSAIQAQSEAFLNSSFSNDAALLGGAIYGANNLVSGLTTPLIKGALDQMTLNNSQLPSFYNRLASENFTLGQGAIAAEQATAQASIQSSQAAAQSAGGCYVTSAVCDSFGLPDDCHTLKTLRAFRDQWLKRSAVGRAFIAEYYATAPALCAKIRARADAREYLGRLYDRFILPALLNIETGNFARAFKVYREMIYTVRGENA